MKKDILLFLLLIYIILPTTLFGAGESKIYHNKLNSCKLTKQFFNNYEPMEFNSTNNLLYESGKEPMYCGEKIVIKGVLLDERCVPISDAKVYLWQAGCDGKYPYKPLRKMINKKKLNINNGSSFIGSGIATTNNEGEFYFVTVYPNYKESINIRVQHRELGIMQTQLRMNKSEEFNQQEDYQSEATKRYNFKIVMRGKTLKNY